MYRGYEWSVGFCDALLIESFLTPPLAPFFDSLFFDPLFASSSTSSSPLHLRPLSPVPVANADALGATLAGFEAAIASVEEFIGASASFQDSQEQVGGYRHMLRPLAKSRAVARVIREGREYPSRTRPQPLMIASRTESWIHFLPSGLCPRRPRWPEAQGEMGLATRGFSNFSVVTGQGVPRCFLTWSSPSNSTWSGLLTARVTWEKRDSRPLNPMLESRGGWVALVNEIADQTIFRTVIRGISAPIFPVSPGSSCHSWVSQIT